MTTTPTSTKQQALILLRKYDEMKKEIRNVERDLAKAVTIYGREQGLWGFNKDMFRIRMEQEASMRLEDAADRDAWEKSNG
jgi:hypothetical protein